jgi:alpha-beta hydrolase superfamily lysophospholipase
MILVLLHGSGTEGRYLIPLAKKLSFTAEVSVVIPDLRGHGRSALSNMGDIDYLGQYEHDLEDFNSHLRSEYPDSRIILGGHSSGGGLAVKYGGGEHIPFDGYLLLAPYLGYRAPTVRPNSGGWVQVSTRRYAGIAMLNNVGITLLNRLPVLFFNRPPEWTDALQADSYSYRLNESFSPQVFSENLEKNNKPILVLVGSDDEAFYAKEFESVFNQYAPHADVRLIAGARHLNLPNSEMALDSINKWLSRSTNNKAFQRTIR